MKRAAPGEAALRIEPPPGPTSLAELARALPEPATLPAGGWVAVSPDPTPQAASLVRRLLGRRAPATLPLWLRCTALLLRGYADVCADTDGAAWGRRAHP